MPCRVGWDNYQCFALITINSPNFKAPMINFLVALLLGKNTVDSENPFKQMRGFEVIYLGAVGALGLALAYPPIATHMFPGFFVYIWVFVGIIIAPLVVLPFLLCALHAIAACCKVKTVDALAYLLVAAIVIGFTIAYIALTEITVKLYGGQNYIDAFVNTFTERRTDVSRTFEVLSATFQRDCKFFVCSSSPKNKAETRA